MSSTEKKKQGPFVIKGIPIEVFLAETGDFKWKPNTAACGDKEHTKEILKVLNKMPEDKRAVWTTRCDIDETIAACPIIREDQELSKAFTEFSSVQKVPKLRNTTPTTGGEEAE